jgi:hypothetical protein
MEKTALEAYQHDQRFRATCISAVAEAMHDAQNVLRGPDEIREREVYEIALHACMLALKRAFDNDAELAVTRIERDHYKKLAVQGLDTSAFFGLINTDGATQPSA